MLKIDLSKNTVKALQSLPPKHQRQVSAKILSLQENPQPHDSIVLKSTDRQWRRVDSGEYRITNTESKQVTNQGQKSPENSQNNDPKNALNKIEISIYRTEASLLKIAAVGHRNDDRVYRDFERGL